MIQVAEKVRTLQERSIVEGQGVVTLNHVMTADKFPDLETRFFLHTFSVVGLAIHVAKRHGA